MAMPRGATEVLLFGRVPACMLVPSDAPLTDTMQRLMARTAELMRVRPPAVVLH